SWRSDPNGENGVAVRPPTGGTARPAQVEDGFRLIRVEGAGGEGGQGHRGSGGKRKPAAGVGRPRAVVGFRCAGVNGGKAEVGVTREPVCHLLPSPGRDG